MHDPMIINYSQQLSLEDKAKLLPLKFDEYDYVIAFKVYFYNLSSLELIPGNELPSQIGTFSASISIEKNREKLNQIELKNCTEILS